MNATKDMPVSDEIGILPTEWIEQEWAGTYVGWSPPYFPNGMAGSHLRLAYFSLF